MFVKRVTLKSAIAVAPQTNDPVIDAEKHPVTMEWDSINRGLWITPNDEKFDTTFVPASEIVMCKISREEYAGFADSVSDVIQTLKDLDKRGPGRPKKK